MKRKVIITFKLFSYLALGYYIKVSFDLYFHEFKAWVA
jgi:hypothetical protein